MINLLVGAAIVALLYYGLKFFAKADARRLAKLARTAGGAAALLVAAFLGLRGQFFTALPLGLFGLSLLGWNLASLYPGKIGQRSAGGASKVRTAHLDMQLDHDSGRLGGTVVGGRYDGVALDALDLATLAGLNAGMDVESRRLLEAYLDRRFPGWREHGESDAGGGQARPPQSGAMTEQEAYDVLGLQPGASADEIGQAHRRLMKRLHPDQGGTTHLAARVNNAKDVLMRRHS
ncbi:MAG TPA: DnaJ domain-containing protein [Xanthobacteraceae bacterium]|nr:DnaJ domain-containing protein [Xanthobacteraceae bacterium]